MPPVLDKRSIQRQLLESPGDIELWRALSSAFISSKSDTSEQPNSQTSRPVLKLSTSEPKPLSSAPLNSSIRPGTHRPIQRRFHPEGSPEAESLRLAQLAELQSLAENNHHNEVLERLGRDLLEPLATRLSAATAYELGQSAYKQERFEVAAPLMKVVIGAGEVGGDLLLWAELFFGLSCRGLGEIGRAREELEALVARQPSHDAGIHALLAIAWIDFNDGATSDARKTLDQLRQHPLASSNLDELDLIGRVLSTLDWLKTQPREQISHKVDRASSDGVVMALDTIHLSRCGRVLQLHGWLVDPGQQLRELCLIRGERVWRMNMGQARYTARPDLADVVKRCGGDEHLHPGLTLTQLSLSEEAVPLQAGESAKLFAVLNNGTQFCLSRTMQGVDLSSEQVKAALDTAIQEPCRLLSANLLHRARELWSVALLAKLKIPAEQMLFGKSPTQPELSVVVPLYGRVDLMEYQLNWFNCWQRRKGNDRVKLQLIYVLDDPRLKQECLTLAKRCNTLYATPFELILNPENLGFAGANNRGAEYAKAPLLLLLNSDVLPAHDDSLELMLRAMQQHSGEIGALGARLLFDNGAIQHQGMAFVQEADLDGELGRVWLNEHPYKGVKLPPHKNESQTLREMEAVTAACLMLEAKHYRQVMGLSSHYIVGDFEDSDLCMKLRSRGLVNVVDRAANFYHLERQSVDYATPNEGIKSKIVAANGITHHQRWCSAIERIKRSGLGIVE